MSIEVLLKCLLKFTSHKYLMIIMNMSFLNSHRALMFMHEKKVNFSVFILFLQVTFGSALLILQISLPLTFSYSEFKFGSEQVSA